MPTISLHIDHASIPLFRQPLSEPDLEKLKLEKTSANGTFAAHLVGAILFTFGLPIYRRWDWDAIAEYDYWTRLIPFLLIGGTYILYRFLVMRTINRAVNADLHNGEKLVAVICRHGDDPKTWLRALGRMDHDSRSVLSERYAKLAEGAEMRVSLGPLSRILLAID